MKTLEDKIEEEATRRFPDVSDHIVTEDEMKSDAFISGAKWALVNQWISVEDELPSLQDNVLLLINGFPVIGLGENVNDKCLGVEYWARIPQLPKYTIMNNSNNEPETVTFTVQKGQTNCDVCKFKSLCYDANIELVHLLKCNVYDLNSITEVERQK